MKSAGRIGRRCIRCGKLFLWFNHVLSSFGVDAPDECQRCHERNCHNKNCVHHRVIDSGWRERGGR